MGKSNRIRTNRANENLKSLGAKKKGQGMPGWAMTLITVVLAVAVLLSVAYIFVSANGVIGRVTTVVSSENYKVNANMMSYYFNTTYQNFQSNYSTYMSSSESAGTFSLNPDLPLKDQQFGGPEDQSSAFYESLFLGEFEGTWYDYFMNTTVESVKSMLVYCEYAKVTGIELSEEDMAEIDANMSTYDVYASSYPSADAFYSAAFGEGVSESDVRECMELSLLASRAMEDVAEKIEASVTDEDINTRYNADKVKYDLVDYVYYTFTVNYDEIAEEVLGKKDPTDAEITEREADILAAYKTAIEEMRADAAELQASVSVEAFRNYIYTKVVNESVEELYNAQAIDSSILPTEEGFDPKAYFIEQIAKDVLDEILEGRETADGAAVYIPEELEGDEHKDDTVVAFGKDIKVAYATVLNTVKDKAFTEAISAKNTYNAEKVSYISDEDNLSKWAFADGRVAGEKYVLNAKDGANDDGTVNAEITNKKGTATVSVYYLTKAQYRDEELSKNFSYMTFGKEDDAKAAISALVADGTYTVDAFNKVATDMSATANESVTDYQTGQFGVAAFDTWLFDEATVKGSITSTPISAGTGVYLVALYDADGKPLWELNVKTAITEELAESKATELTESYPITVKDKNYKFINVVGQ